jgi:hypothetical protein
VPRSKPLMEETAGPASFPGIGQYLRRTRLLEDDREAVAPAAGARSRDSPHRVPREIRHYQAGSPGAGVFLPGSHPDYPAAAAAVFKEGPDDVGQKADAGETPEMGPELAPGLDGHRGIQGTAFGEAHEARDIGAEGPDGRRPHVQALVIHPRCLIERHKSAISVAAGP